MMKIAVVGATGPTGMHLVTELRKTVAAVRVIVAEHGQNEPAPNPTHSCRRSYKRWDLDDDNRQGILRQ